MENFIQINDLRVPPFKKGARETWRARRISGEINRIIAPGPFKDEEIEARPNSGQTLSPWFQRRCKISRLEWKLICRCFQYSSEEKTQIALQPSNFKSVIGGWFLSEYPQMDSDGVKTMSGSVKLSHSESLACTSWSRWNIDVELERPRWAHYLQKIESDFTNIFQEHYTMLQ